MNFCQQKWHCKTRRWGPRPRRSKTASWDRLETETLFLIINDVIINFATTVDRVAVPTHRIATNTRLGLYELE